MITTAMLASYVVSDTEDSLADCRMMAGESLLVITTEMLVLYAVSGTEDSLADCRQMGE